MEKHKALRAELEKYTHDAAKVNALVDDLAAAQKVQMQERVASIVAIKQILTEDQFNQMQAKMNEKRAARRTQWGEKFGQHKGPNSPEGVASDI